MKHYKKLILIAAVAAGLSTSAHGSVVRVTNNTPTQGFTAFDASGATLSSHGAGVWTFETGVFAPGFTPESSNWENWAANWQPFAPLTAAWQVSGPNAHKAQQQALMDDATLTGQQAVIWGFNSQAIDAASQWITLTNSAWVFPVVNPLQISPDPQNIWNMSSAGTMVVGGAGSWSSDSMQLQAIPEPSTYALIFGLGILGFLGFRRFRK